MISSPHDNARVGSPRASPQVDLAERLLSQLPALASPPTQRMIDAANAAFALHKRRMRLRTALLAALSPALFLLLRPAFDATEAPPGASVASVAGAVPVGSAVPSGSPRAPDATSPGAPHRQENGFYAEELQPILREFSTRAPPTRPAANEAGRVADAGPEAPHIQPWARAGAQATTRLGAPVHGELRMEGGILLSDRARIGLQMTASPRQQVLREVDTLQGSEVSGSVGLWVQPRGPLTAGVLVGAASRWYPVASDTQQRDKLRPVLTGEIGADIPLASAGVLHPSMGVSRDLGHTFIESNAVRVDKVPPTRITLGLSVSIPTQKKLDPIATEQTFVEDCHNCGAVEITE